VIVPSPRVVHGALTQAGTEPGLVPEPGFRMGQPSRLMMHIIGAMAEFERELIRENAPTRGPATLGMGG
jgi:hypothetical protein